MSMAPDKRCDCAEINFEGLSIGPWACHFCGGPVLVTADEIAKEKDALAMLEAWRKKRRYFTIRNSGEYMPGDGVHVVLQELGRIVEVSESDLTSFDPTIADVVIEAIRQWEVLTKTVPPERIPLTQPASPQ